jgi:hypothetical protein
MSRIEPDVFSRRSSSHCSRGLAHASGHLAQGLECLVARQVVGNELTQPGIERVDILVVRLQRVDAAEGFNAGVARFVAAGDRSFERFGDQVGACQEFCV